MVSPKYGKGETEIPIAHDDANKIVRENFTDAWVVHDWRELDEPWRLMGRGHSLHSVTCGTTVISDVVGVLSVYTHSTTALIDYMVAAPASTIRKRLRQDLDIGLVLAVLESILSDDGQAQWRELST
jgi:hypothetical protein